jgi:hypothetical protein
MAASGGFRGLIAARPLLAHVMMGSSLAAGWEGASMFGMWRGAMEDAEFARAQGDKEGAEAYEAEANDLIEGAPYEVAAASIIGGLRGAAMRFYYPWMEGMVESRIAGTGARAALKIAIDHAPAFFSTFGVHWAATQMYEAQYGLPADPSAMRDTAEAIGGKLTAALEDARRTLAESGAAGATVADAAKAARSAIERSGPTIADAEQVELIDTILSSQPSPANAASLALTVINFTVVPRWLRGVVGTFQWQLWDQLQERENEQVGFYEDDDLEWEDEDDEDGEDEVGGGGGDGQQQGGGDRGGGGRVVGGQTPVEGGHGKAPRGPGRGKDGADETELR